jgi:hypothetical protein
MAVSMVIVVTAAAIITFSTPAFAAALAFTTAFVAVSAFRPAPTLTNVLGQALRSRKTADRRTDRRGSHCRHDRDRADETCK